MKILDCESVDSTYASLEQILGISRSSLESLFDQPEFDLVYKKEFRQKISREDYVLKRVQEIATLRGDYDQTCWFHLTRTVETNQFKDGILPLPQVTESIWNFLYSLVSDTISESQWEQLRTRFSASRNHHAWLYRLKTGRAMDWGPFGILVRDMAFARGLAIHDYLSFPEIIEDICICFAEEFGVDMFATFQSRTKPCIVKFLGPPAAYCLRPAVYYLYSAHRKMEFDIPCNTCFANEKGLLIPFERIRNIEFPKSP